MPYAWRTSARTFIAKLDFEPDPIINIARGFDVAFYKDMGSAHATMNVSTINIPSWSRFSLRPRPAAVLDVCRPVWQLSVSPRKVSNQVLIQLHKAWAAFFEAMKAWKEHPEQFTGRPKLPGYKYKTAGRNLLIYEKGAIWKRELDRGVIAVSGLVSSFDMGF